MISILIGYGIGVMFIIALVGFPMAWTIGLVVEDIMTEREERNQKRVMMETFFDCGLQECLFEEEFEVLF